MAISLYSGLPGSGKSYGVVANVILPAVNAKRIIWSNIPVTMELQQLADEKGSVYELYETDDIKNDPEFFIKLPPGCLFILDEAWELWPAGLNMKSIPQDQAVFLTKHRHYVGDDGKSTEIVLVTQDGAQLSASVRQLIGITYRSTKLTAAGMDNRYRVDICNGCVTGNGVVPVSKRLSHEFGTYDKEVYKYYNTSTVSEVAGDDKRVDRRGNSLGKLFSVLGLLVVLLLGFLWGLYSFLNSWGGEAPKDLKTDINPQSVEAHIQPAVYMPPAKQNKDLPEYMRGYEFSIVLNNGQFPNIDYVIRMRKKTVYADLRRYQLASMGIDLEPISQCLVRISYEDFQTVVGCESGQDQNWVDETYNGIDAALSE